MVPTSSFRYISGCEASIYATSPQPPGIVISPQSGPQILTGVMQAVTVVGTIACPKNPFDSGTAGRIDFGTQGFLSICVAVPIHELEEVGAAELCGDRLGKLISRIEEMPPSYNKFLLQGAAQYSRRVLRRINQSAPAHKGLLLEIRKFASDLESLRSQYSGPYALSFGLLDLQSVEDRFDLIQKKSAELRILPVLQDISTAELLQD